MIGVISNESDASVVREFFEFFKTPWRFLDGAETSEVLLTTGEPGDRSGSAKVVIVLGSERCAFDDMHGIRGEVVDGCIEAEYGDNILPVYGRVLKFEQTEERRSVLPLCGSNGAIGVEIRDGDRTYWRLGVDLFSEVSLVLTEGQPIEYARSPTIEIYRDLLRGLIVQGGVPVVEIPPVPHGYEFAACLSHDVDFVWVRRHGLDHTLFGFLYRALFGTPLDWLRGKVGLRKVLTNWFATLKLPFVHLGLVRDFWSPVEHYTEIERRFGSTFYFVPKKGYPGVSLDGEGEASGIRATRYDVGEIASVVRDLVSDGFEVGLHGLDAWGDPIKGREERRTIQALTSDEEVGVRMHWLYSTSSTAAALDDAGFEYDSTVGYNGAVGYRAGTSQVYRPFGVARLLELPMHIQDTALFYPCHMGLGESEARTEVRKLLDNSKKFGGVVTVNWHHRSLAPERLWGDFYREMIAEFERRNAWIGTARRIVRWYRKRRSVSFEEVQLKGGKLKVRLRSDMEPQLPQLVLRVHRPRGDSWEGSQATDDCLRSEFAFSGTFDQTVTL